MYITIKEMNDRPVLLELPDDIQENLMELLIRYNYIFSNAMCSSGTCDSCHIHILKGLEKLPQPTDEEVKKLEKILWRSEDSRLACHILVNPAINGLIIKV